MTIRFTLFLLLVVNSQAATFYCDPVKGSAKGDGSAEQPWRTIEEVVRARLIQLCDQKGNPCHVVFNHQNFDHLGGPAAVAIGLPQLLHPA